MLLRIFYIIQTFYAPRDNFAALEADVEEVDKRLSEEQTQLSTLTTYKDKEYPLKALRITSLQKEIEQLAVQNTVTLLKTITNKFQEYQ